MYARKLFACCCVMTALHSSFACSSEDLIYHYQLALEQDPRLRVAAANRGAVDERLTQAGAALLPTLSASATRNRNSQKVVTDSIAVSEPAGRARYDSTEYRLNLSQPIYHGELFAGIRAADADVRGAQYEYEATKQELMARVVQAYLDALFADDNLSFARSEKDAIAHQMESAQARLKTGLVPVTDVNDAEAEFQGALARETEALNQLDDKQEALREMSGQRPAKLARLSDTLRAIAPEPANIKEWTSTALKQNPSILAATSASESAHESIRQNRAAHYPTVDIVGSKIRSDSDESIDGPGVRSDNAMLGVQLRLPLYQGGAVNSRVREAAFRYDMSLQQLESRRRNLERTTRTAFNGVTGGIIKIDALRRSVRAATEALTAKSQGYSVGIYKTQDVLDATRDVFRAQRDFAQARYAYVLSLIQLKQSAGSLNDDDLKTVNSWLTPDESAGATAH